MQDVVIKRVRENKIGQMVCVLLESDCGTR